MTLSMKDKNMPTNENLMRSKLASDFLGFDDSRITNEQPVSYRDYNADLTEDLENSPLKEGDLKIDVNAKASSKFQMLEQ